MPKKGQYTSKEEKKDMDRKARWGCVVCRKIDMSVITPAEIHHIRKGSGMGQRGSQTIPLCYHHHRSPKWGIHGMGTKAWTKLYGTEEELLAFYEEHKND